MHPVEKEIIELIQIKGPISFAQFMEISLYSKKHGYYSNKNPIGKFGDYYTSPHTHPLFGWVIGTQIFQMWQKLDYPSEFYLIEPGSGNGILGKTILESIKHQHPTFFDHIRYIGIDINKQTNSIANKHSFIQSVTIPLKPIKGCILSNELFDSFPVHRFKIINGSIKELFVDWSQKFIPFYGEVSNKDIIKQIGENISSFPDGYESEVCLYTSQWVKKAIEVINQGYLLTIDYGYLKHELYDKKRKNGTIQSYYNHATSYNFFENVGAQDITTHVDFTEIIEEGKSKNALILGYTSQKNFLENLGGRLYIEALRNKHKIIDSYTYNSNRFAMSSLMNPDGLGNFKVLLQGINVPNEILWGFEEENSHFSNMANGTENIPTLLADENYIPLLKGRYPLSEYENPKSWMNI
tara:strand:+ start:9917 stop:11146 length:1230 start_codon:yes stop_codon:yes gene_type:complete